MKQGFVAITTSIILTLALLLMAVTAGSVTFAGRMDVLRREFKKQSAFAARSCLNLALLAAAKNRYYVPAEQILLDADTHCEVASFIPDTPMVGKDTFVVQGLSHEAVTKLEVIYDRSSKLAIISEF